MVLEALFLCLNWLGRSQHCARSFPLKRNAHGVAQPCSFEIRSQPVSYSVCGMTPENNQESAYIYGSYQLQGVGEEECSMPVKGYSGRKGYFC